MRILYLSDIHLEIRDMQTRPHPDWIDGPYPLQLGPSLEAFKGEVDLAVLAGDIGRGDRKSTVSSVLYAQQVAEYLDVDVIFVPGNHDYYRGDFDALQSFFRAARYDRVHILDRGEVHIEHEGENVRILGATLWTDYAANGTPEISMIAAAGAINDHRVITRDGGNRRFTTQDALKEHWKSRTWISEKLDEPFDGPTVVVTHHVPHPVAHNRAFPIDGPLTPAFQSDCSDLVAKGKENGVIAFIYGHHHASQNEEMDGILFLSAQLGYPNERTDWRGPGILDTIQRKAIP